MRLPFGLELTKKQVGVSPVYDNRGSWWPWIHEPYTGAWQRNDEWTTDTVLAHQAVFTCISLISQDVGKLRPKLVERDDDGIWTEVERPSPFAPVLRKPNTYQNHIQFKEWWIISKLIRGNSYALKERDQRGVVVRLYLLDPGRVKVLIAPDGSVFYELAQDNLSGLPQIVQVPASEIIHDRINCLFHPLVGVSPIFACGTAANLGLKVQTSSTNFFGKGAQPSGIITTPTNIDVAVQERIVQHWNSQFQGANAGRVAVLGNNMTFTPMTMKASDSQLVEQLKWTAETVCSVFHVPPFKIGIGAMPAYPNAAESLNRIYYSDCLQSHIESFELAMDEGLGIGEGVKTQEGKTYGVELDVDVGLLRMDTQTQMTTLATGTGAGIIAPNEGRARMDLKPVKGGEQPYLQQQNFGLAALAERDKDKPFAKPTPAPAGAPADDDEPEEDEDEELAMAASASGFLMKELGMLNAA